MNRKIFVVAAAFTLIMFTTYVWVRRETSNSADALKESTQPTDETRDTSIQKLPESNASQTTEVSSEMSITAFCRRKIDCADDPLIPNSEAELRWMQQHGYPTKEERDRLSRLSVVELQEEANRGALTAMTALGSRMVSQGDNNGLSWILKAANQGSIYAYYAKSDAVLTIRNPGFGLTEAGAYLRVAYILGDYKAGQALSKFATNQHLDMAEMREIDRRANELYQTYARNRQPTPRPQ